jgi:hypothetical protein
MTNVQKEDVIANAKILEQIKVSS